MEVRTLLDRVAGEAYPEHNRRGCHIYARVQTLTANLGYIFTNCLAEGLTGCTLTPEQITLALNSAQIAEST